MASEVWSGTTTDQGREEKALLKLPPGFRFFPTDEELILHYLCRRKPVSSLPDPVIADVDIYKFDPWDLPVQATYGNQEWYFFSLKDRKYATGMRTNRATGSGYWKATSKEEERGHRGLAGMKKTLVYYTGRAPIEHGTGVDLSARDMAMRITAADGELREGRRIYNPPPRRYRLLEHWKDHWVSNCSNLPMGKERDYLHSSVGEPKQSLRNPAHDDEGFNMAPPKEEDTLHCSSVRAPKLPIRSSTSLGATLLETIQAITSALKLLRSSLGRPIHGDLKPDNILLDEKTENQLGDFGMSKLLHANDYTVVTMGSAVPTRNRPFDAKFSGKSSSKYGIEMKIAWRTYLSVHHHPLVQMIPSARKWSGDTFTTCARLITSNRIFGTAETGWISAKHKYEALNAGSVSEYIIRKLFGNRNGLTVNESLQHSDTDSSRSDHGKRAVKTTTAASWIIATGAPHHATGDRNLLSGFITEHDDQFVHAVNRAPMKVLARGAVVTDALTLPDVWFVPGLKENLVSVSQLAELDHSIGFGRGECCIRSASDARIVGKGRLQKGGHYMLDYLKVPLAI